jgi:phospholipase A1
MTRSSCCLNFAALCLALLGGTASAQTGSETARFAGCATIENATERLTCYDAASGRAARPGTEGAPGAQPSTTAAAEPSIIDGQYGFNAGSDRYAITPYGSNYLLLARYSTRPNDTPFTPIFQAAGNPDQQLDSTEAKFQISFKARVWTTDDRRWGLWLAYTQQNQWQVYNESISRPFRETNYSPEIFGAWRPGIEFGGWQWNLVKAGFIHQSNGRADPLSRSWNRLYAEGGVERGDFAAALRVWTRISESEDEDDNPDITDYYGYASLSAMYRWRKNTFTASVRGNISERKGAYQLGWFSQPLLGPIRGYVQIFSGYGESLIDYNWKQTTYGIGIAINDGFF